MPDANLDRPDSLERSLMFAEVRREALHDRKQEVMRAFLSRRGVVDLEQIPNLIEANVALSSAAGQVTALEYQIKMSKGEI